MQLVEFRSQLTKVLKIVMICLSVCVVRADGQEQQLTAPPPPKIIAKDEQQKIDAVKDTKDKLKLIIELAEIHLTSAEQLTAHPNFEAASTEVGTYFALIDFALKYLATFNQDKNKTRDLYKRMELALRAHGPRLTAMRRTTPLEYAVWIKEVEEFARDGRTEALNSFYGHTVVRENSPKPSNEKLIDSKRKDNSLAPDKKQP
jgi:hypothetical protein